MEDDRYKHTQRGSLHWLLLLLATGFFALGIWAPMDDADRILARTFLWGAASLMLLFAFTVVTLTVSSDGHRLRLRYGPVPLLRKTIYIAEIENARAARSRWIDGFGIHYVPLRGWTYNLWGRDCVELTVGLQTIRVGSDEPQQLAAHLDRQIAKHTPSSRHHTEASDDGQTTR